jgi:hypothetical protein
MPSSPMIGRQRPIVLPVIRIERERDGEAGRIERERDGEPWLVLCGDHAWLHGDRRQALGERDWLDRAERLP